MKTIHFLALANLLLAPSIARAKEIPNPLMASDTVVWAGLDYSLVRMIGGSGAEFDFRSPERIFPAMLDSWNQLFLDERIERLENTLGKHVLIDDKGTRKRNAKATASQVVMWPGPEDTIERSHLSTKDIAAEVKACEVTATNGLGLIFIIDRLVSKALPIQPGFKSPQIAFNRAAIYVVFFDVATREILSFRREVRSVSSGGNFRNFWFGPIKDVDESLRKYRTKGAHFWPDGSYHP